MRERDWEMIERLDLGMRLLKRKRRTDRVVQSLM